VEFYSHEGWDSRTGHRRRATLDKLGLSSAAGLLEKTGKLGAKDISQAAAQFHRFRMRRESRRLFLRQSSQDCDHLATSHGSAAHAHAHEFVPCGSGFLQFLFHRRGS
jgi:hypothetical protein